MADTESTRPRPRRMPPRKFQYSLRTFLVVCVTIGLLVGLATRWYEASLRESVPGELNRAIQDGKSREVDRLLTRHPWLLRTAPETPFVLYAVQCDEIEAVRVLLAHGADMDAADSKVGWIALHYAAAASDLKMFNLLLSAKPDVNAQMKGGFTALHLLPNYQTQEKIMALLDAGTRLDIRDDEGATPLHRLAALNDDEWKRALMAVLGAKADIYARDDNGATPLHYAAGSGLDMAITVLIQNGAKLNARDKKGQTPLHWACKRKPNYADILLSKGADPNLVDHAGRTPLHIAAESGSSAATHLVWNGADILTRDRNGKFPLAGR